MTRWPEPPRLGAAFFKAHGLGNDYLVFEEGSDWLSSPQAVSLVCDRYRGVGADGIVVLLRDRADGVLRLRMFNPDGSEFERSGNGLRILAAYAARRGLAGSPLWVEVGGERVSLAVHEGGGSGRTYDVSVDMGPARVGPEAVDLNPAALDAEGRLAGPRGEALHVVPVSVGNPHLVVLADEPSTERLAELGPFLVGHPALTHGANVQLARPLDATSCRALIWERGVGPTSASGTSSCAVAVACVAEGLLPSGPISVHMPGGTLHVTVTGSWDVELRGPVDEVCTGELAMGMLRALEG